MDKMIKKAMVVGMARSGIASARLLSDKGYSVVINDMRESVSGLEEALIGIPYIDGLGKAPETLFDGLELIVLSPGVNMFQGFIDEARGRGIEVIGELELGWRYSKGDFLCVTGTNGKTTCTALLGEMCKLSGRRTFVLGNIGVPLTQYAADTREGDFIVVEAAALQIEGNSRFHAKVAAVCNVSEDHLDRFKTMDYYTKVKSKLLDNQTGADVAVLNYDDPITRAMQTRTPARVLFFSRKTEVEEGVFMKGSGIYYRLDGQEKKLCEADEVNIPGAHNLENAMLCAASALSQEVEAEAVVKTLRTFPGVEHRIEFVCEKRGVRYINDSKGTNPDSTIKAINAMDRPTVLILGGYDKHSTFEKLFNEIKRSKYIKSAVVIGETADKLMQYAKEAGVTDVHLCRKRFKDAVELAASLASPGDSVLLSPACASWDMFENFEERGRAFKQIVNDFAE